MAIDISNKLVIGISSRALFDLRDSNDVFEKQGVTAYAEYQIQNENEVLSKGVGFALVQKLLRLNQPKKRLVEVILLSRNSADTGLRVFNSIEHYGLDITRAVFTQGKTPFPYIKAFNSDLFLSANPKDVCLALKAGWAAATLLQKDVAVQKASEAKTLNIAFDGDAVIFSNESERIFQTKGLKAFTENEKARAKKPLSKGPFKGFLNALHALQRQFPPESCPIRTALVTARQAPAHERVIRTLRKWEIRIDEAFFLGGLSKVEFLKAFKADIFFDDYEGHCRSAQQQVTTGHVPNRNGTVTDD
jgi:5'-nucleotidase